MDWNSLRESAHSALQGVFGESVTHHPLNGPNQAISAVFSDEHTEYEETGRGGISTTAPKLEVQISALDNQPQIDDEWTVGATRYRAVEVMPDGHGGAAVMLREK